MCLGVCCYLAMMYRGISYGLRGRLACLVMSIALFFCSMSPLYLTYDSVLNIIIVGPYFYGLMGVYFLLMLGFWKVCLTPNLDFNALDYRRCQALTCGISVVVVSVILIGFLQVYLNFNEISFLVYSAVGPLFLSLNMLVLWWYFKDCRLLFIKRVFSAMVSFVILAIALFCFYELGSFFHQRFTIQLFFEILILSTLIYFLYPQFHRLELWMVKLFF